MLRVWDEAQKMTWMAQLELNPLLAAQKQPPTLFHNIDKTVTHSGFPYGTVDNSSYSPLRMHLRIFQSISLSISRSPLPRMSTRRTKFRPLRHLRPTLGAKCWTTTQENQPPSC